jgi:hypothetical protein
VLTAHPVCGDRALVPSISYRILVKGRLTERFGSAFDGVRLEPLPGQTALVGEFTDAAQLDVVLERLQDFGIEVLSVNDDD